MVEQFLNFIYVILGTLLATVISLAAGAFIASVFWSYWGWFVVPISAPHIGFFHSWGLVLMVGLVVPAPQMVGSSEEIAAYSGRVLVGLAVAWAFGFLLHSLI